MLENHPLNKEDDQEIRGFLETAHNIQVMGGTNERQQCLVKTLSNDVKVFMMREEKFDIVEDTGEFIKERNDSFSQLSCGCTEKDPSKVRVDVFTGELTCTSHIVYCLGCKRAIALHNAKEVKGEVYCAPCAKTVKLKSILFFPAKMVKEILYGFAGMEVKRDKPRVLRPERGNGTAQEFPQQRLWTGNKGQSPGVG